MRIAYLTCVYPPYPGGIGIVAQGLARQMAKRGHAVEVFTQRQKDYRLQTTDYRLHELRPWLRWGNGAFLPQLLWKLRGFDIVHLLYPFFGVAELLPILRRISRAKIIVHHTMDAAASGLLGKVFSFHNRRVMPRLLRHADCVIALSEDYFRNCELTCAYRD